MVGGRILGFAATAAMVLSIFSPKAADASIFDITFSGTEFNLSALISTDGSNNASLISGSVTNNVSSVTTSFTGLDPVSNSFDPVSNPGGIYTFDNLLTGTSPFVSNGGIVFDTAAFSYNLYSVDGPLYFVSTIDPTGDTNSPFYNPGDPGILSVTAVPEASTWAMLLLGFVGIGFANNRRKNRTVFRFA